MLIYLTLLILVTTAFNSALTLRTQRKLMNPIQTLLDEIAALSTLEDQQNALILTVKSDVETIITQAGSGDITRVQSALQGLSDKIAQGTVALTATKTEAEAAITPPPVPPTPSGEGTPPPTE